MKFDQGVGDGMNATKKGMYQGWLACTMKMEEPKTKKLVFLGNPDWV